MTEIKFLVEEDFFQVVVFPKLLVTEQWYGQFVLKNMFDDVLMTYSNKHFSIFTLNINEEVILHAWIISVTKFLSHNRN